MTTSDPRRHPHSCVLRHGDRLRPGHSAMSPIPKAVRASVYMTYCPRAPCVSASLSRRNPVKPFSPLPRAAACSSRSNAPVRVAAKQINSMQTSPINSCFALLLFHLFQHSNAQGERQSSCSNLLLRWACYAETSKHRHFQVPRSP